MIEKFRGDNYYDAGGLLRSLTNGRLPREASEAATRLAELGGSQPSIEGAPRRRFGTLAGKISMSADFNAPLRIVKDISAQLPMKTVTPGIDSEQGRQRQAARPVSDNYFGRRPRQLSPPNRALQQGLPQQ